MVKRALPLFLLAACIPGPHAYVGARCDDAHPCPLNLLCVQDLCAENPDGGAGGGDGGTRVRVNVMPNGDFEGNPLTLALQWTSLDAALDSQSQVVRTGARAAKLEGGSGTRTLLTQSFVIDADQVGTYCAEAWARGRTTAELTLIVTKTAGGDERSAVTTDSKSTTTDEAWTRLFAKIQRPTGVLTTNLDLKFTGVTGPNYVDDVVVWFSLDGSCAEP